MTVRLLNSQTEYGSISRALHWIIVLAIVVQWLSAEAEAARALHYSVGLAVVVLAVVRLGWRAVNPTPAWPADMKPYEVAIARAVHVLFYALLFAIPLSGWALASVDEEPLRFFNAFDLPRVALAGEDALEDLHEALFNILAVLAVLHIAGAARHWLARRRGLPRATTTDR